jgi:hypothetical protein
MRAALLRMLTPLDAALITAELEARGIPVWTEENLRQDDFAIAQRILVGSAVKALSPTSSPRWPEPHSRKRALPIA